jgi:hypothetical protein
MDLMKTSLLGLALLALSACASGPTVSPSEPHGIVVLATAQTARNNFQVQIREIDGVQIQGAQNAYWLAPGRHTLRLTAILTNARPMIREVRETRADHLANAMVLDVEDGKRYVIAARRVGQSGAEWEPVVLEVEDIR